MNEYMIQRMTACRLEIFINGKDQSDQVAFEQNWEKRAFETMDIEQVLKLLKEQLKYLEEKKQDTLAKFAKISIKQIERKLYA